MKLCIVTDFSKRYSVGVNCSICWDSGSKRHWFSGVLHSYDTGWWISVCWSHLWTFNLLLTSVYTMLICMLVSTSVQGIQVVVVQIHISNCSVVILQRNCLMSHRELIVIRFQIIFFTYIRIWPVVKSAVQTFLHQQVITSTPDSGG